MEILLLGAIVLLGTGLLACAVLASTRRASAAVDPESIAFSAAQAAAIETRAAFASLAAEQREHEREQRESERALGTAELEQRRALIDRSVAGLTEELTRVSELVRDLDARRGEKLDVLTGILQQQRAGVAELTRTAADLREALSSSKARGQWGERMAEDVLRLAGFLEGVQYAKQRAVAGGRGIPDFTFFMPGGSVLYMDVKFPLDNYLRALEAGSDAEQERHRGQFLRDVRAKVKELADRAYQDADGSPLDCVLLFIPNESLYGYVQQHDPALLDQALTQKVVMCSPLTLFAVLAVIRQAVDSFRMERTAGEILDVLGAFGKQWEQFSTRLDALGRQLETTQRGFDQLAGPRRRQLERQLERIDELRKERTLRAVDEPADCDEPTPALVLEG
jgi:DNA recombination protein RmuC